MTNARPDGVDGVIRSGVDVAAVSDENSREILVVRHPIFNPDKSVWAYELLVDDVLQAEVAKGPDVRSGREVIHDVVNAIGLENLVEGRRILVNVTADMMRKGDHRLLPSDRTVLRLHVAASQGDEALEAACHEARGDGYALAIPWDRLDAPSGVIVCPGDIAQFDLPRFSQDSCRTSAKLAFERGLTLLASGVRTHADFAQAVELGCAHVQGTFFQQAETASLRRLLPSESVRLQLLTELNGPEFDLKAIEDLIRRDIALSCGLLKLINSSAMGVREPVSSLRQALTLLGEKMVRRWAFAAVIGDLSHSKPRELLIVSVIRARFCESLGIRLGLHNRAFDLFLTGLLSAFDAVMDMPMADAADLLPLHEEVRAALLGDRESALGRLYALVEASERGAWSTVGALSSHLRLTHRNVAQMYYESVRWGREALG